MVHHGGTERRVSQLVKKLALSPARSGNTKALARAEGKSLNETVKQALKESVESRRKDPKFKARVKRIIEEDRELLERLAK